MKNPLNKRILPELKQDFGKYLVIFSFLTLLIALVSGFLVATNSCSIAFYKGLETHNVEHGHLSFQNKPSKALLESLEEKADLTLYELPYVNVTSDRGDKIRIYPNRTEVNLPCIMDGRLPEKENEIALDRLYAENNSYNIGDHIKLWNKNLTIVGTVALQDYSALFENNTDSMFNASNFSIAVMTKKGFERFSEVGVVHNYAWRYNSDFDRLDDAESEKFSDKFLDVLEEVLIEQRDQAIILKDYVPQHKNQALQFPINDIGGDTAIFLAFNYLVIIVIAFVFAVTISNTIRKEAGVIGTLRASGYTKLELICHYIVLPILVTLLAGIIGNILGYTVLKDIMAGLYYHSYSLIKAETIVNGEAFLKTTIVPIVLMFVINFLILKKKLNLAPIRFLRHDLTKTTKHRVIPLSNKIPFLQRFRLRVILQNLSNYVTLFIGIFLGSIIIVFSLMFMPIIDDYRDMILDTRLCNYQYILKSSEADTDTLDGEKFLITSLNTTNKNYVEDEVTVYGVSNDSDFISSLSNEKNVLVSSSYSKKYRLKPGDTITLKDPFIDKYYKFTVDGVHEYYGDIAIFINENSFKEKLDGEIDYSTGVFSNEKLDILENDIAKQITTKDLTMMSDQLEDSMGGFMYLLRFFGVIMFLLLMYLLSKQIIEHNANSISMAKILGFKNKEIGSVYILSTSIVVIISLIIVCPLTDMALKALFENYLYTQMTGYFPYFIHTKTFVQMIVMGLICFAVIALIQLRKIYSIPKVTVLKNLE